MTTIEGVDYSAHNPGTPSAAALEAAGKHFVCTYVVDDGDWRANTPGELAALEAGGIVVVSNWEGTASRMNAGYAAGVSDAQNAQANVIRLGLPPSMPIYFSADWDASPAEQANIDAYLQGCASVLGASRVGLYGGYWPITRAAANGTAQWFWQTSAWSGGNIFSGAHLYQYAYNQYIDGVNVDNTRALQAHFGQHSDFVKPPAPATLFKSGDMVTVSAGPLHLRASAGILANIIASMPVGTTMRVLNAPTAADGFEWYHVESAAYGTGYCVGDDLALASNPAPAPTPTPPPAPVYAKPVPVPGPIVDQVYNGTPIFALPPNLQTMETARDGVQCFVSGAPNAQLTGAPLAKGTKVNPNYLFHSATANAWMVIDKAGSRILLADLLPLTPPAPAS